MRDVYVVGGFRTPIMVKNNKFKNVKAEELAAAVLRKIVKEYELTRIDGIIGGNAVGTGGNITRLASLVAGIPEGVPAFTLDAQCASSAGAISWAYSQIAIGMGDVYIAGGMESASLQPLRIYNEKDERYSRTEHGDGVYVTAQFSPDEMSSDSMLWGAERTIVSENISKAELDYWTLLSHKRAYEAQQKHILDDIIVEVNGYKDDDGIRGRMSQKLLDRLPLILGEGTHVTAGNSCLINDGAAFVCVVSEDWLREHPNVKPQAKIIGAKAVGGDPVESPRGAMRTADALLASQNLTYEDMAAIEFNEAFASIDVMFQRAHENCLDKYNVLGGALAYGHPYGASGGILMLHLLKALQVVGGGKGIMSIAGAGGMGQALMVETV